MSDLLDVCYDCEPGGHRDPDHDLCKGEEARIYDPDLHDDVKKVCQCPCRQPLTRNEIMKLRKMMEALR